MTGRIAAIALLTLGMMFALDLSAAGAASRAHVYLFRGLADVFSTGMDTLADELNKHGVYATSHSHSDWKSIADKAAADYKGGKEGPIILIGHSLGADAVMEMADYLGDKGVPVALVMPFDGTQSFPASANISRVVNLTQRDYAYMRPGPGFRGSLVNVDLSADRDIGHLNIDKVPRLHARAISEVLAVVGGHMGPPVAPKPAVAGAPAPRAVDGGKDAHGEDAHGEDGAKSKGSARLPAAPEKSGDHATAAIKPEAGTEPAGSAAPATAPPRPVPSPVTPAQIPD